MTRPEPTILDRLQVGGLKPEIVAAFKDRRRKREPCRCALCLERAEGEAKVPA